MKKHQGRHNTDPQVLDTSEEDEELRTKSDMMMKNFISLKKK
jgi:hypothetical protein